MELSNVLVHVPFTRSNMELDIYHKKLCIRVALAVAKQFKTWDLKKLGNVKKTRIWVPASLAETKLLNSSSQTWHKCNY